MSRIGVDDSVTPLKVSLFHMMRRFHIFDALLLTLAVAIACGINGRLTSNDTQAWLFFPYRLTLFVLSMLTWTLAIVVIADKKRFRGAVRTPGKLALIIISAFGVASMTMHWDLLFFAGPHPAWWRIVLMHFGMIDNARGPAAATIACWLTLHLAKIERPRSDWLDTMGLIIGTLWILCAVANPFLNPEVLRAIGVKTE